MQVNSDRAIHQNEYNLPIIIENNQKSNSKIETLQQQNIKKRNEIIEEYIKSLDNKTTSLQSNNNSNNFDDDDDAFSLAVKNFKNQHKKLTPNIQSINKVKRFSSEGNSLNSHKKEKWNFDNINIKDFIQRRDLYKLEPIKTNEDRSKSQKDNIIKKRYNTAKTITKKLNLPWNKEIKQNRIKSTLKPSRTLEGMHNYYYSIMNDPNNPYSTNWVNKYLKKNYNMKLGMNGFLNGVPVITLNKKEKYYGLSKKEIKEKLTKMQKKEMEGKEDKGDKGDKGDNEDNISDEMEKQFLTNRKNFYQIRKDITEESDENEGSDEEKTDQESKEQIEFPVIYQYFKLIQNNK